MPTTLTSLRTTLADWTSIPAVRRLRQLATSDRAGDPILLALAVGVGLGTGLLAVALVRLIAGVQLVAFGVLDTPWSIVVVPTAGALAVGLFVTYVVPEARGSGVPHLMRSIALEGGRVRPIIAGGKVLATGVALGTGASGGRESPIVQIGGTVGSSLGRLFAVDEDQKRALIAAGAGAGIAASFNAPIAGMLFALEVILGGFRARYLQVIVVSCVVASVTAREIVGPGLIYNPPPFRVATMTGVGFSGLVAEFALYALVGVLAAAAGLALVNTTLSVERVAGRSGVWQPLRLAAGGLGVGLIALVMPGVLGTGDDLPDVGSESTEPIADMLAGTLGGEGLTAAAFLLALGAAKLVASALSMGTGNAVGLFAPSIFIGAALGGALGHAAGQTDIIVAEPGAFALVGMAAMVGAVSRAPLTAVLIVFELTGDYGMVLPLMLATGLATFAADRVQSGSVFTLPLRRQGIVYAEPEDVDIMQTVTVREIMTDDTQAVDADATLPELHAAFRRSRRHGFPVIETTPDGRERLFGVVTLADLARASGTEGDEAVATTGDLSALNKVRVRDVATTRVATVTPGDPVFRALRRMATLDVGRLPVVDAADHSKLVGLVRRADIVEAYQRAVTRSIGVQQRQARSQLRELSGTQFVELVVAEHAPAAGHAVRDVAWPARTILTAIRRLGEVITPGGDTVLEPGDEVVVLTAADTTGAVRELLTTPEE